MGERDVSHDGTPIIVEKKEVNTDELMKSELAKIKDTKEFIHCQLRMDAYQNHNKKLRDELKPLKRALDTKYHSLNRLLNLFQVSIIIFSTVSGFLQATKALTGLSEEANTFIGVTVSTYTSFLLAVVKYNKWDEKKEQIHNLREQFSEFIVQIERRDDLISCWKQDNFWAGTSIKEKDKLWKEEMTRLDNEIPVLIEKKQSLVCNYEQIMDKVEVDMLRLRERRIDKQIKEKQISLLEAELHLKQNEQLMEFEHKKQELINKKILEMINSDNCGSKYLVYDFHQMGRIVKGKNPESSSSILSKMKIISPNNNTLVTIPDTESIDEGEPDV